MAIALTALLGLVMACVNFGPALLARYKASKTASTALDSHSLNEFVKLVQTVQAFGTLRGIQLDASLEALFDAQVKRIKQELFPKPPA